MSKHGPAQTPSCADANVLLRINVVLRGLNSDRSSIDPSSFIIFVSVAARVIRKYVERLFWAVFLSESRVSCEYNLVSIYDCLLKTIDLHPLLAGCVWFCTEQTDSSILIARCLGQIMVCCL